MKSCHIEYQWKMNRGFSSLTESIWSETKLFKSPYESSEYRKKNDWTKLSCRWEYSDLFLDRWVTKQTAKHKYTYYILCIFFTLLKQIRHE